MALSYNQVLSVEDILYLSNLPEVLEAKNKLNLDNHSSGVVYFTVTLPESMKEKIKEKMSLDLTNVDSVPMRWIQGDTKPHVDFCSHSFDNTYLMYMNDNQGKLIVEKDNYPITQGTAYVFNEGMHHETVETGYEPRLLLGPMNERGLTVGTVYIVYFSSEYGAVNLDPAYFIAQNLSNYQLGDINIGSIGSYTKWKIASSSTGSSSQLITYNNGDILTSGGAYFVYPVTSSSNTKLEKPKNQQQALRQSYKFSSVWRGYKYYEKRALKFGFTRIDFSDYKILYKKNH